jgi:hypothetical protein
MEISIEQIEEIQHTITSVIDSMEIATLELNYSITVFKDIFNVYEKLINEMIRFKTKLENKKNLFSDEQNYFSGECSKKINFENEKIVVKYTRVLSTINTFIKFIEFISNDQNCLRQVADEDLKKISGITDLLD